MSLVKIPVDILHMICDQLNRAELKALRRCSKLYSKVAGSHLFRELRLSIQEPAFTQAFFLAASEHVRPEVHSLVVDISRAFDNTISTTRVGLPPLPDPRCRCVVKVRSVEASAKDHRLLGPQEADKIQCGLSMIFKQLQNLKNVTISTNAHPNVFQPGYIFIFEPRTQILIRWILENMASPQQPPLESLEIRTGKRPHLNLNDFAPFGSLMAQASETKSIRFAFQSLKSLTISTYVGPPAPESFSWLSHGLRAAAPTLEHLHLDFCFDANGEDHGFALEMCACHFSQDVLVKPSRIWELLGLDVLLFPQLRNVTLKNVAHHTDYASKVNRFLQRHNQVESLQKIVISSWSCETGLGDFPTAEAVSKMTNGVDDSGGLLDKVVIQRDFDTQEENCKNDSDQDLQNMTYWRLCLGELKRRYREGHSAKTLYRELAYQVPFPLKVQVRVLHEDMVRQIVTDHVKQKVTEKILGY